MKFIYDGTSNATTFSYEGNRLVHHGIKGQKWGIRRFQNKDGSLTLAGKKRYGDFNGSSPNNLDSVGAGGGAQQKNSKDMIKRKLDDLRKVYDLMRSETMKDSEFRSNLLKKYEGDERFKRQFTNVAEAWAMQFGIKSMAPLEELIDSFSKALESSNIESKLSREENRYQKLLNEANNIIANYNRLRRDPHTKDLETYWKYMGGHKFEAAANKRKKQAANK